MQEDDKSKARSEDLALFTGMLQMQNEVSYVIECLSEDFRGEAARGMKDAYESLEKQRLPGTCAEQIEAMLDEAVPPLNSRNLVLCSRKAVQAAPTAGESAGLLTGYEVSLFRTALSAIRPG